MILKVHNFLKIIFLLFCVTKTVVSVCRIRLTNNPLLKPGFSKQIGSRTIQISNDVEYITMQANEEIIAYCDVKFKIPDIELKELKIKCNYYIYINEVQYGTTVGLKCASLKWNLYELSEPFIWCPSSMSSYILARPKDGPHSSTILAFICYDTDNMSLKSMYYTMTTRYYKNLVSAASIKYNSTPRTEIKYVKETFGTKRITPDTYDNQQFQDWIKFSNYQYNSAVQNPNLYNEVYNEFDSLLDFVWWPNLRLGNWKLYEEALARYVENENKPYNILSGISGVVMAPIKESCQNNYTMKKLIDKTNRKIPLYVWNYLLPTYSVNRSYEFVVIGYNSPFYEFYSEKDVVFCQDICNEIDWLKNVRSSFRYSAMGVMFCCSVKEVQSSKRIHGFPQHINEPKTTTTPKPTPLPLLYEDRTISTEDENNNEY